MHREKGQPQMKPKLAMGNILQEVDRLKAFAQKNGFHGIDWSFDLDILPETPLEESRWVKEQSILDPLEVRYHCPFYQMDLGHDDPDHAKEANTIYRRIIRLVSRVDAAFLSIHIGLGHDSTEPLSWEASIDNLKRLVQFGAEHRVKVCLENLAWGWTSRPNLFEKLIRRSGAGITIDIGHAYACEWVRSQQYAIEDFVSPHPDRVYNAHIYHTEISGYGHVPPKRPEDLENRLTLLQDVGCEWWLVELKDPEGLLLTKTFIEAFLNHSD
jgi:sugar phosphate isomerase/epimerase